MKILYITLLYDNVLFVLIMIAGTHDEIEQHGFQPLSHIKENPVTDLINQLDIADGLKELLISKSFTLNMLLDTPVSELAKILGRQLYC